MVKEMDGGINREEQLLARLLHAAWFHFENKAVYVTFLKIIGS